MFNIPLQIRARLAVLLLDVLKLQYVYLYISMTDHELLYIHLH